MYIQNSVYVTRTSWGVHQSLTRGRTYPSVVILCYVYVSTVVRSVTNDTPAIRSWSRNFGYVYIDIAVPRIYAKTRKQMVIWVVRIRSQDSENQAFCFYAILSHDFEPRLHAVWCFLFRCNNIMRLLIVEHFWTVPKKILRSSRLPRLTSRSDKIC